MKIKHKHRDRYVVIRIEKNTDDDKLYRGFTHSVKLGVMRNDGFFGVNCVYDSKTGFKISFQYPVSEYGKCWIGNGLCYTMIECKGKQNAIKFAYNLVTEWFNYHEKIYQNTNE